MIGLIHILASVDATSAWQSRPGAFYFGRGPRASSAPQHHERRTKCGLPKVSAPPAFGRAPLPRGAPRPASLFNFCIQAARFGGALRTPRRGAGARGGPEHVRLSRRGRGAEEEPPFYAPYQTDAELQLNFRGTELTRHAFVVVASRVAPHACHRAAPFHLRARRRRTMHRLGSREKKIATPLPSIHKRPCIFKSTPIAMPDLKFGPLSLSLSSLSGNYLT